VSEPVALQVVAFESRRASEIATLIRRHGGVPFVAPSMREVPLADQQEALAFARALDAGDVDIVLVLTGVGTRALVDAVAPMLPRARLVTALGRVALVARGPKPVAALRELGLTPTLIVPEPNTWREILQALDARVPVAGRRVAVQEYGVTNPELLDGLTARGASVLRVPVYRWALPEDSGPLLSAAGLLARSALDVAVFTNGAQVEHLFRTAPEPDAVRAGLARMVIASVGPVCSEALEAHGVPADLEASPPKMGPLVALIAAEARAVLGRKRGASC
jgi:uroporphyrinogen-III synthase